MQLIHVCNYKPDEFSRYKTAADTSESTY